MCDYTFKFEKEINAKSVTIEIVPAPLTQEAIKKPALFRGYKCQRVCIDGEVLKAPSFVSCYAETNRKEGPSLGFKFGMAQWIEEKYGLKSKNGQALYLKIPRLSQPRYLEMIAHLDADFKKLQEEAVAARTLNDENIKAEDIIEMAYSTQFVRVTYPFESNRAKKESKIWSQFDGILDLDDWIELNLEPYCVGLGCGGAKKYRFTYEEYAPLLAAYKAQL